MRVFAWLALTLLALPLTANEGDIKYRQHTMGAVGGHMRAIVDIVKKEVSHESHLPMHASALAALASIGDTLFPAGSDDGETDALPAIWEDPDDFAMKVDAFKKATADFNAAVGANDNPGKAFQAVGQACKGCHDSYRAE